jgi:hypothetical protein
MSRLSITELYDHLVAKLGKETAEKLTTFIAGEMSDKFEYNVKTLATKEDLAKFALVTKEDLAKLDNKINETKIDIIKWIFAFWVTVILLLIGLYFKS